jgi:hypothetical protein
VASGRSRLAGASRRTDAIEVDGEPAPLEH